MFVAICLVISATVHTGEISCLMTRTLVLLLTAIRIFLCALFYLKANNIIFNSIRIIILVYADRTSAWLRARGTYFTAFRAYFGPGLWTEGVILAWNVIIALYVISQIASFLLSRTDLFTNCILYACYFCAIN